jgi:hypothetical protein
MRNSSIVFWKLFNLSVAMLKISSFFSINNQTCLISKARYDVSNLHEGCGRHTGGQPVLVYRAYSLQAAGQVGWRLRALQLKCALAISEEHALGFAEYC